MTDPRINTARPWKTTKVMARILIDYPEKSVLDFGCGKYCRQLFALRDAGRNADGYDIWFEDHAPPEKGIHSRQSLPFRRYGLVALSNVINIQRTPEELRETLLEAQAFLEPDGVMLFNYPHDPRYLKWTASTMRDFLEKVLGSPVTVDRSLWVWKA